MSAICFHAGGLKLFQNSSYGLVPWLRTTGAPRLSLRGVPADLPAAPGVPTAQCGIQTPHSEVPVVAPHWRMFKSLDSAASLLLCQRLPDADSPTPTGQRQRSAPGR